MHAALDVNIPNYASAVVTTNQIVDSLSSVQVAPPACDHQPRLTP
jgi:ureidoacrylate peracid hydrolase